MTAAAIAQQPAATPEPALRGYMIGPGDQLTGKVLGEPQFDFIARVDEQGNFSVPFVNKAVSAKCRNDREVRAEVTDLLSKYLKNPQVSLEVTDRQSRQPVVVYGEVNTPQQFGLMRKVTLLELLAFSGGVKEEARGVIQVFRSQRPMCADAGDSSDWTANANPNEIPSRMYTLDSLKLNTEESNPVIYPGDVIVVEKAPPVYITGEVNAAQGIYLKDDGLSLQEALAKVGGTRTQAKLKDIKVYRLKPNSKEREVISANMELIAKGVEKDIMLQPYDIIEVGKAKKSIAQMILEIALGAGRTALQSVGNSAGYRVIY